MRPHVEYIIIIIKNSRALQKKSQQSTTLFYQIT